MSSNSCAEKEEATKAETAKATDWQNHSIRGFISGNVTKKMGLEVQAQERVGRAHLSDHMKLQLITAFEYEALFFRFEFMNR